MGYSDPSGYNMTLRIFFSRNHLKELQLVLNERTNLFAQIPESVLSDYLTMTLKENIPLALAIYTELLLKRKMRILQGD